MWKKSPYTNEDLPHPHQRTRKLFFRDALIPRWVRVKTYTYWPFLLRGGSQTSCRRSVWWLPADPERALDDSQRQARFRPLRRCRCRAAARRGEQESSARSGRSQPQGGGRSWDPPPASAAQRAGLAPLAQRGAKRGWEARRRRWEPNPSLEEKEAGAKAGRKGSAVENAGRESVRRGGGESQCLLPEGETRRGPLPGPPGGPHRRLRPPLLWPPLTPGSHCKFAIRALPPLLPPSSSIDPSPALGSQRDGRARRDPRTPAGSPQPPGSSRDEGEGGADRPSRGREDAWRCLEADPGGRNPATRRSWENPTPPARSRSPFCPGEQGWGAGPRAEPRKSTSHLRVEDQPSARAGVQGFGVTGRSLSSARRQSELRF